MSIRRNMQLRYHATRDVAGFTRRPSERSVHPVLAPGLYPLLDVDACEARGFSPRAVAEALLAARPPLLQLRAKRLGGRDALALARELVPLCRAAGAACVINDRADVALLAGAGAVHVGQDDLPVAELRRIAPALRVGVSTHRLDELEAALAERPAYVAFGPLFPTRSKHDPEPVVGLDALARAAELARAAGIPLCAIGGIDLQRAPAVAALGVTGAVIGALVDVPKVAEITERARALHLTLGGA